MPDDAQHEADQALSPSEQAGVESGAPPRAIVVHEIVRRDGEHDLGRPAEALAWSGLAAGLSMGFSMIAEGLIQARLPEAPWRTLIASVGYSLGFLIVILGRQQLFTESTLTAMLPVLYRRDRASVLRLARLWVVVFVANILGTIAFAVTVAYGQMFEPEAHAAFTSLGRHVADGSFVGTLIKAVFAGWLIALMVWLLPVAGSARMLIILVLTYVVALADLSHVIAGSAEAAYAVAVGAASVGDYLFRFLIPALIGNTLGGVALVAVLNHAQVSPELSETP